MKDLTGLLDAAAHGDPRAASELLPLVYDELRRLAAARLAQEKPGQTLDATALVHEAYLRLVGRPVGKSISDQPSFQNRGHFFAAAAEAMRRILIGIARHKKRSRHGGGLRRVGMVDVPAARYSSDDLLDLDEMLTKLTAEDAEAAELVKLRLYAGQSVEEAGESLGISRAQAYRHWTYARAWLHLALGDGTSEKT